MNNESLELCQKLCYALSQSLNSFLNTSRLHDLFIYVFMFAKACYISYSPDTKAISAVSFEMYRTNAVTVHIDVRNDRIIGYVENKEAYAIALTQTIADYLFDDTISFYNFSSSRRSPAIVFESKDKITIDLLA